MLPWIPHCICYKTKQIIISLYTSLCSHWQLSRPLLNAPAVSSVCHKYRHKNSQHLKIHHSFSIHIHSSVASERMEGVLLQHFLEPGQGRVISRRRIQFFVRCSALLIFFPWTVSAWTWQPVSSCRAQQTSILKSSGCLNTCAKARTALAFFSSLLSQCHF